MGCRSELYGILSVGSDVTAAGKKQLKYYKITHPRTTLNIVVLKQRSITCRISPGYWVS